MHKLTRIVVTGPAVIDNAACAVRGIAVRHLPTSDTQGLALIGLLEALVGEAKEHSA